MGMSVGSEDDEEMIGTINTTPLVDVMLVLLIIFLITIPVVTHTVPVKLPEEKNTPYATTPENIQLSVNKKGDIFWNVSVHDKFHRTLILSGFCLLKIAKISLNSSFFPK
ncbi:ExbD/TolR family protein, partial [Acinetobacter baumannii]|uniref:ExbD/TolR family protein n=1 Tax=Acinetobacter baumannii TaxID=470 RepID=UPI002090B0C6